MTQIDSDGSSGLPGADLDFLRIFVPYELALAQRRAMVWGSMGDEGFLPSPFIGLYLIRLEPAPGERFPSIDAGGREISNHVFDLLHEVIRDSDIPALLSDNEILAVLRDIDPQYAFVVAQRFLTSAGRSKILRNADLRTRVGYVIYPLSSQPNFPVNDWATLLYLARRLSARGERSVLTSGFGVLRGPQMVEAPIPEADLVPLLLQDPDSLIKAGLVQVQRIHLLPSMQKQSTAES